MANKEINTKLRCSRVRNADVVEMCNYLSTTYDLINDEKLKHKTRGMILGYTFACNGFCGKKDQVSPQEYNERIDLSCAFARNKQSIVNRIKDLDEQFLITLDENKSIEILGEIIALCAIVFCEIEKPKSINDAIWNHLCKGSKEEKDVEIAKFNLREKAHNPKTTRDLLLNSYKDLLDN